MSNKSIETGFSGKDSLTTATTEIPTSDQKWNKIGDLEMGNEQEDDNDEYEDSTGGNDPSHVSKSTRQEIAREETLLVDLSRIFVILFTVVTALLLGYFITLYLHERQKEEFRAQVGNSFIQPQTTSQR